MTSESSRPGVDHLFLCSTQWFSAVSDYCLQLLRFVAQNPETHVTLGAPSWSPLRSRLEGSGAAFEEIPIYPKTAIDPFVSWHKLGGILRSRKHRRCVVWTFEGREQTLCAVHRILHPKLWRHTTLVRVRGQDAPTKSTAVNRWLYTRATDKIVFAADVVRSRTAFDIPQERSRVQHYCAAPKIGSNTVRQFAFAEGIPDIDFSQPVLLLLGRYDPVKGHRQVLEAFAKLAERPESFPLAQLVFIGRTQNIRADDLHAYAEQLLGKGHTSGRRFFAQTPDGHCRVFMFDEQLSEAPLFVENSHLGIVSSLGSEVICRVAVEFLQAGTPIIASAIGALPEVLGRVNLPVFPAGNVEAITEELVRGVARARDETTFQLLRRQTAEAGEREFRLRNYASLVAWVEKP